MATKTLRRFPCWYYGLLLCLVCLFLSCSLTDPGNGKEGSGTPGVTYYAADNAAVRVLAKFNGKIIVGGLFDYAGGINLLTQVGDDYNSNIAAWDPSAKRWSKMDKGLPFAGKALHVWNDVLYAGGSSGVSSLPDWIMKWDGASWSGLGAGPEEGVYSIASYGNALFVGGTFTTINNGTSLSSANIAQWNGSNWSEVGAGFRGNSHLGSMETFLSSLYVGGPYSLGQSGVADRYAWAQWNGSNWSYANAVIGGFPEVYDMAIYQDFLVAVGNFPNGNDTSMTIHLGKISSNGFISFAGPIKSTSYVSTNSIAAKESDLYVGGTFTTAGGIAVNNIAHWNGTEWKALGEGIDGSVATLLIDGNDLYVGGTFKTIGGMTVNNVARWDGSSWHGLE